MEIAQDNVEGFRKGTKIAIKMKTQQVSVKGEENFDWNSGIKVAKFSKFPRSCLKKKNNMKCFIKQSHILRIETHNPGEHRANHSILIDLVDGKSCGYLEPDSGELIGPLILMVTKDDQDRDILVGFCVDNPNKPELQITDRKSLITTFTKMFKENIKYNMVSNVVDQIWTGNVNITQNDVNQEQQEFTPKQTGPMSSNSMTNIVELARSVLNNKTTKEAKNSMLAKDNLSINRDLINTFNGSLSILRDDLPRTLQNNTNTRCDMSLVFKSHADWKIILYDKDIDYLALFVDHGSKDEEHVIFCQDSVNLLCQLTDIYDTSFTISSISNMRGIISHLKIEQEISIKIIEDLSSFEQHFLKMGICEEDAIIIEMEMLQKLFEQFEMKHESKVMVINKLESFPPLIFCSVTSEETMKRVEAVDNEVKPKIPSFPYKRKHHNPDEIIEGRPKWSKIKLLRTSTKHEITDQEEKVEEEILDFDRLNPHRSHIQEFDDNFDNTEERYQKVVLKMMADLQSETVVVLGNSRLGPEQDKKCMEEFLEWEKYKKDNNLHSSDFVTRKKSKVDERLKIKDKIITKNPRKVTI